MARFSMELRGHQRVGNNLRRMASSMDQELDAAVGDWTKRTRTRLKGKAYPAMRPGQRYRRTGQLANRWATQRLGPSHWAIQNRAQGRGRLYATYVVGDGKGSGQSWHHRGRWWKARDVVDEYTPELVEALTRRIRKLWEG